MAALAGAAPGGASPPTKVTLPPNVNGCVIIGVERVDCPNWDLHGADLRQAILNGANLAGADLSGANLNEARLPFGVEGESDPRSRSWP